MIKVTRVHPELMILIPARICHRWQQQNPTRESQDVKKTENAPFGFGLSDQIGYIGEPHVIAKCVHDEWRHEVTRPHEQIRRVNAEHRRVKELEERDHDRGFLVHARPKTLDHVVKMSCANKTLET